MFDNTCRLLMQNNRRDHNNECIFNYQFAAGSLSRVEQLLLWDKYSLIIVKLWVPGDCKVGVEISFNKYNFQITLSAVITTGGSSSIDFPLKSESADLWCKKNLETSKSPWRQSTLNRNDYNSSLLSEPFAVQYAIFDFGFLLIKNRREFFFYHQPSLSGINSNYKNKQTTRVVCPRRYLELKYFCSFRYQLTQHMFTPHGKKQCDYLINVKAPKKA